MPRLERTKIFSEINIFFKDFMKQRPVSTNFPLENAYDSVLQKLVRIIVEPFDTEDVRLLDALNRSETFKHYINFNRLKISQVA